MIPPKAIPPTVRTVGRSALITRPLASTAEKVAPVEQLHPSVSAAPPTRSCGCAQALSNWSSVSRATASGPGRV